MKLPQPRKIIAEKYVAGLSLFKSRRSPIKLSANESALGPSPKAVKSYSSVGKGFVRYPDSDGTYFRKVLAKKFKLIGMPTTVLLDKDGYEFGRIMGEFDFNEKRFKDLLKKKINL